MKLVRRERTAQGIFGELFEDDGTKIADTLEHAYQNYAGNWMPKIPRGAYLCKKGEHRLHNMTEDFTTFEITGVVGHIDVLFHWGNFNNDSEGCVLLGTGRTEHMILDSRETFKKFMDALTDTDEFTLQVDP